MKLSDQITRRHLFVAFGTSSQTGSLSSVDLAATRDDLSVALSASDGSVAPIAGADASTAGVMTAADKAKLDSLPPAVTRIFSALSEIPAAVIGAGIASLRTNGHAAGGDGGGASYQRVAAEPTHPGKAQSADGAWWELVPEGGRIRAEQLGAVNAGAADDHAALTDAIAVAKALNVTLLAKGKYRIDSTLVFPPGQISFEGPDGFDIGATPAVGFVWGGANSDVMVEIQTVAFSRISNLFLSNTGQAATGMTGILIHNESGAAGTAINHNILDHIYIEGVETGLQVGDFTNDAYDSNFDDNEIRNIGFRDVANPLVIDSDAQDNLLIGRFHNGGPTTLSAHVGTRNHIIHVKRNGNGFRVMDGFARTDGIVADNAAIRIDDGSFTCDYFSFEGSTTARLIDLNDSLSRDQSLLSKVVTTGIVDSSGRAMVLNHRSGTVLTGCSIPGDIECQRPVIAMGTVFEGSAAFTITGSGEVLEIGTQKRSTSGSALTADSKVIDLHDTPLYRTARFNTSALNASSAVVVDNRGLTAGNMEIWQIAMESGNDLKGVFRLFVWRNAGGAITGQVVTDLETSTGTVITVTDNGATYDVTIENTAANNKFYSGWIETRNGFTI